MNVAHLIQDAPFGPLDPDHHVPGGVRVDPRRVDRQPGAAPYPGESSHRRRGAAVGSEPLQRELRRLHPHRRDARRSLRAAAGVRDRVGPVRRRLAGLRPGTQRRGPDRRARPGRRGRRARAPRLAVDPQRQLRRRSPSHQRPGGVGQRLRSGPGGRAVDRRLAGRALELAKHVLGDRAGGGGHHGAGPAGPRIVGPGGAPARPARPGAGGGRAHRALARPDPGAELGVGIVAGRGGAGSGGRQHRGLRRGRAACGQPDGAAGGVRAPAVHRRRRRTRP